MIFCLWAGRIPIFSIPVANLGGHHPRHKPVAQSYHRQTQWLPSAMGNPPFFWVNEIIFHSPELFGHKRG